MPHQTIGEVFRPSCLDKFCNPFARLASVFPFRVSQVFRQLVGLVALHFLVSLVFGDFYPRIQMIDVYLVICDRHRNAPAGVLRRRAVAMTITRYANAMATINDKDADIQWTEAWRGRRPRYSRSSSSNICLRALDLSVAVNGALLSSSSFAFTCSLR